MGQEPSMEEILSSIKKIIAEEGDAPDPRRRASAPGDDGADDATILELTPDSAVADDRPAAAAAQSSQTASQPTSRPPSRQRARGGQPAAPPSPATIVSPDAAAKSRDSLAALSALLVQPDAPDNTLEGLVRELLRPMLREWLDARLPEIVESMVAKEIARITGRAL